MPDDSVDSTFETSHLTITTSDGIDLSGELGVSESARVVAVLTHPHPLMGGDMHSMVTEALFRALPASGIAALRFDFRGAGTSAGEFGNGTAEADDVTAALTGIPTDLSGLPCFIAGYSFGADVALQVLDHRIRGWLLIAPPLRSLPARAMVAADDPRPKLVAVPEHDQFNPPQQVQASVADWANTRVEVVPGGDHFLAGRAHLVTALAKRFAEELLAG